MHNRTAVLASTSSCSTKTSVCASVVSMRDTQTLNIPSLSSNCFSLIALTNWRLTTLLLNLRVSAGDQSPLVGMMSVEG